MNGVFARVLAKNGQDITIEDRESIVLNGLPSIAFTKPIIVRAVISTLTGVNVFDSTNIEVAATHKICLNYVPGMTTEKWIKIGSKRLRILTVENCCELNCISIFMCTERGDSAVAANAF